MVGGVEQSGVAEGDWLQMMQAQRAVGRSGALMGYSSMEILVVEAVYYH